MKSIKIKIGSKLNIHQTQSITGATFLIDVDWRIIYLSSCVLELVAAAIVLFMTFCWGFLTAIRRAQSDDIHRPLSLSDSSIHSTDAYSHSFKNYIWWICSVSSFRWATLLAQMRPLHVHHHRIAVYVNRLLPHRVVAQATEGKDSFWFNLIH